MRRKVTTLTDTFRSVSLARRPGFPAVGRRFLSDAERDMIRLVREPGFKRWLEQIHAVGGCAHPVYLSGGSVTRDIATGEVLRSYDTESEPGGRLAVRCRNRRETVCAPCSRLHAGDTFHLVRSGLQGGKGTPVQVADHPRLFLTLTAPSFGAVHRVTGDGGRCRPRRDGGECEHGRPVGCGLIHAAADPLVGQPLCADCYDYCGHVLWHAHAGRLWDRFCHTVRRHLATAARITQSRLPEYLRMSFAKVSEYQKRGAVHFHAVVRLDGPESPGSTPPGWATVELLESALRSAARAVEVRMPYVAELGEYVFRFGREIDVSPIGHGLSGAEVTDQAVAGYVAKYVSKSVGEIGGVDQPVRSAAEIPYLAVSPHARALMGMCFRLARLPELEGLRLRAWVHMLGYRGHVLTKSRRYSTTYGALREARGRHAGVLLPDDGTTVKDGVWRFVGSGHTPAEAEVAAGIAADVAELADIRREQAAESGTDGGPGVVQRRGGSVGRVGGARRPAFPRSSTPEGFPGWAGGARRAPQGAQGRLPDGSRTAGAADGG